MERFEEALNYYASLFDCLERASAAQAHRCAGERARAERLVLGEEIRGLISRSPPLQQAASAGSAWEFISVVITSGINRVHSVKANMSSFQSSCSCPSTS